MLVFWPYYKSKMLSEGRITVNRTTFLIMMFLGDSRSQSWPSSSLNLVALRKTVCLLEGLYVCFFPFFFVVEVLVCKHNLLLIYFGNHKSLFPINKIVFTFSSFQSLLMLDFTMELLFFLHLTISFTLPKITSNKWPSSLINSHMKLLWIKLNSWALCTNIFFFCLSLL